MTLMLYAATEKPKKMRCYAENQLVEISGKEMGLFVCIRDGLGDRPCFVEYVMGRLSQRPVRPERDAVWSKIKNERNVTSITYFNTVETKYLYCDFSPSLWIGYTVTDSVTV
jgi:hypothetical protein